MDIQLLIETVTAEVMSALREKSALPRVCVVSERGEEALVSALGGAFDVVEAQDVCGRCDYVVLSRARYDRLVGMEKRALPAPAGDVDNEAPAERTVDFSCKKVLLEKDVKELNFRHVSCVKVSRATIVTALASDMMRKNDIKLIKE